MDIGLHHIFGPIMFVVLLALGTLTLWFGSRVIGRVHLRHRRWWQVYLAICSALVVSFTVNTIYVAVGFTRTSFEQWMYRVFHFDDGTWVIPAAAVIIPTAFAAIVTYSALARK